MAMALSDALQREFARGASRPVWLIELYPRPDGWTDTQVNAYPIRFCWSDTALTSTPASRSAGLNREQTIIPNIVANVTALGATLDPLNRNVTQEDVSIELIDDGTLRNIMAQPGINNVNGAPNPNVTNYLFGQKLVIKVGFQSLDISEYLALGKFMINEVTPREGIIELQCRAVTAMPYTVSVSRNFRTRSPHGQMHEILGGVVGLDDASGTYDEGSVDAWYTSQPANDIDKRHWAIARQDNQIDGEWMGVTKAPSGEDAWSLLSDICSLTGGFICERENGKITYVPYVEDAAAVKNLGEEDIDQFTQEVTYANLQNEAVLEIASTIKTTKWEPAISSSATQDPPDANFGGVQGNAIYTSRIDEAGQDASYPDRPTSVSNRRFLPFKKTLEWESGMSSAALLQPRVVTYGDSYLTTNDAGTLQGKAYYTHSTRKVTLVSGKLNVTHKPSGSLFTSYVESDYIDVTRGPVIRVMGAEPTPGNRAGLVSDASGNSVLYKEGRIESIDNSGLTTVLTLADDMYLEFEDDWGSPSVGFNWVILEPSFPVTCQPRSFTLYPMLGLIALPEGGLSSIASTLPGGPYNAHFSRYFYIQWAAMTGVAGANIQFASTGEINAGAPYAAGLTASSLGGPAHLQFKRPNFPYTDLRLHYGHSTYATGATSAAPYAQLQGAERTRELGIANDVARFAEIKLEYDQEAKNSFEYIKCNLAHPLPAKWGEFSGVTVPPVIRNKSIQRSAQSAFEPDHAITGGPRAQTSYQSTFVYRVDCQSVTVGYSQSRTGVPAWDANQNNDPAQGFLKRERAIRPSGRAQFSSVGRGFVIPPAVFTGIGSFSEISTHYLGARATDVTCAVSVAERVLKRTAYGMPIISFTTSLEHIDIQLGDFISVTHSLYLRHGKDGSTSGTIFEVTRKEVNIESDTPNISWKAAFVRQDSVPSYTFGSIPGLEITPLIPKSKITAIYDSEGNMLYSVTGTTIQHTDKIPGLGSPWE